MAGTARTLANKGNWARVAATPMRGSRISFGFGGKNPGDAATPQRVDEFPCGAAAGASTC